MFKARLVLMIALAAFVMAPVQAGQLDSMDNIAARPWTDDLGTDWLSQSSTANEGTGSMKIDYGVTGSVPDPCSGWDYLGNFVGVGAAGGAFDSLGNYLGAYDRVILAPFAPAEFGGPLTIGHIFYLDVYKTIANSTEHVRELQLYDRHRRRNTYTVQVEMTAKDTPVGWTTYSVPLISPLENNADLSDIVQIRLFTSAWSAYVFQNFGNPQWPADYTVVRPTGTPVLIDNLVVVCPATGQPTLFVDADASGANDGTSWANAFNHLRNAVAAAMCGGVDEIRVAEGIYTPDSSSADPKGSGDRTATFQLISGVAIYGGYAGFGAPDPNARDIERYETILSGDINDSGTGATAVLDGFTITAGNANDSWPATLGVAVAVTICLLALGGLLLRRKKSA